MLFTVLATAAQFGSRLHPGEDPGRPAGGRREGQPQRPPKVVDDDMLIFARARGTRASPFWESWRELTIKTGKNTRAPLGRLGVPGAGRSLTDRSVVDQAPMQTTGESQVGCFRQVVPAVVHASGCAPMFLYVLLYGLGHLRVKATRSDSRQPRRLYWRLPFRPEGAGLVAARATSAVARVACGRPTWMWMSAGVHRYRWRLSLCRSVANRPSRIDRAATGRSATRLRSRGPG
jgi:hypothetical protein